MSMLKDALESGKFGVTAEMAPPKGCDFSEQMEAAALLKGKVHGVNVTDIPLRSSAVMAPPPPAELESLGAGTHLILANGRVFNQPLTTEIGAQVEIRLVRNGFEMIPFTITIASEMQQLQVKGYPVNWKKTIRRSSFLIHGEQGEEIDDVRIVIDGKELTATESETL